jgi:hypothetical protein
VEDDDENKTYTDDSTPDLSTILSSTAFDDKDIDIQSASFTMSDVEVTPRSLVLGDGIETVIYKAKLSVGDADSVTIKDMNFIESSSHTVAVDLDKIIDTATINIGGSTFDADIDSDSIDFNSMNAEIAAGSDNVEVLVTATLKDND